MNNISAINNFINNIIRNEKVEKIDDEKLEDQLDNIFNNILNEQCYLYYETPAIAYNLIGMGERISLVDFTFLIPNLFRSCYAKTKCKIPDICPSYITSVKTVNYFPVLINTNLIK